jgi:hypothetical protein
VPDDDRASNPGTEPFVPDFGDSEHPGTHPFVPDFGDSEHPGTHPFVPDFGDSEDPGTHPFVPDFGDSEDTGSHQFPAVAGAQEKSDAASSGVQEAPETPAPAGTSAEDAEKDLETEPAGVPAQSVTVRGRYIYLKWWNLILVIVGVWIVAAQIGLSLFYWWYHSIDKTPPVFMVLVYVVACAVGGVLLAMVQSRPLISALSLAVMSGPFASVTAAAPLYGYYYCARVGHCLVALIPY